MGISESVLNSKIGEVTKQIDSVKTQVTSITSALDKTGIKAAVPIVPKDTSVDSSKKRNCTLDTKTNGILCSDVPLTLYTCGTGKKLDLPVNAIDSVIDIAALKCIDDIAAKK